MCVQLSDIYNMLAIMSDICFLLFHIRFHPFSFTALYDLLCPHNRSIIYLSAYIVCIFSV